MDPNATLLAIREAVTNNEFAEAAKLFDGLDYWLTRGGFLPSDWDNKEPMGKRELGAHFKLGAARRV